MLVIEVALETCARDSYYSLTSFINWHLEPKMQNFTNIINLNGLASNASVFLSFDNKRKWAVESKEVRDGNDFNNLPRGVKNGQIMWIFRIIVLKMHQIQE